MRALACLLLPAALLAQESLDPRIEGLLTKVEAPRLRTTVEKLVTFGTRNTNSDTTSPTTGIGAARTWLAGAFGELVKLPGSRLTAFEDRFTAEPNNRIPKPTELVNVGAVLPGTDPARAKEAIVLVAHYDTVVVDNRDPNAPAPGANDDGSGVAVIMEMARVMAAEKPAVAVYFVAVAGEEQGLVGAAHLARRLKEEGMSVLAFGLDMIGNSQGQDGVIDNVSFRLFSEGVPAVEADAQKRLRDSIGMENDSPSRELARTLKRVGERYVDNADLWMLLKKDRIGRGGDHTAFSRVGFPAVRFMEGHESYARQHKSPGVKDGRKVGDTPEFFDEAYAAKGGRLLLSTVMALSHAPAPPQGFILGGSGTPDTKLRWTLPADPRITGLVLYRRRADAIQWQKVLRLPKCDSYLLKDLFPDNYMFALATVDAQGHESVPVAPFKTE
jgi:hypothetical protein